MKTKVRILGLALAMSLFSVGLATATTSAARYDGSIQSKVTQSLAAKKQFTKIQASVEDGIVTLSGNVDIYQQKLDAAKKVRKMAEVQGVRNLITVAGKDVPDAAIEAQLDKKLYYDRIGYGNVFNFVTASVQDGAVTLTGEARTELDRDSAISLANNLPGVKDVVSNIKVSPASIFDDRIRVQVARTIYRDPVLSHYAMDPGRPIRIVVDNGHVTLYGAVANKMDKEVAGIRAGQVFGAFSVQNNLQVWGKS
jgi:hyperosmotically inducible periplasmic protein